MVHSGALLPVALAALSGCVLPRCLALMLGADSERKAESSSLESVERGETAQLTKMPHAPPRAKLLSWWTEGSRSEWLSLYDIQLEKDATAIVTHAGKNNQEYIDHAVMLGVSLKRHMPDYPRIVLGVKGMTDANQAVLKEAGWHVVLVADWRFPDIECSAGNKSCIDYSFILQQQDSMERLNIFRLPIGRVLYMDADTYVASGELNSLLNGTDKDPVPEGNIGMVPNACNRLKMHGVTAPYSAGVMLFKPNLEKYQSMLVKVAGVMSGNVTGMSDEQIINDVWGKQATALDKKYNCMDPWDLQAADKCQKRCTEVVVSHFFGGPKPAIADERFLSFVRKPSGPFEQCSAMNHGSCNAWQNFYCDLVDNLAMLTRPLQQSIKRLGSCCHAPALESDPSDCHSEQEDCAETVSFNNIYKLNRSVNMEKQAPWFGNYTKVTKVVKGNSTFVPDPLFHGGRPVYAGPNGYYLFYGSESKNWIVSRNIKSARARSGAEMIGSWMPDAYAYFHLHTKCPENAGGWKFPKPGFEYLMSKDSTIVVADPNAAVESFGSTAMYKKRKKYQILEAKHKRAGERAKKRKMANMEDNATAAEEMIPQDNLTTDETLPEHKTIADGTVPEDKTTEEEAALENTSTGKVSKELQEVNETTEPTFDAETPQVTTADETATADTTAGEMPKGLAESKSPTESKFDAETPQRTTVGEMSKGLEESKAPTETKLDYETPQGSASEFKMVLDRTSGRKLGIKVSRKDGVTLQVTGVTGDLAEQWNDDHPELAVYRGDSIIEVNGIANDASKLFEECKQNKMLELVVKRGQADSADEADETATADATTAGEVQQEAPQASSLVATRQKLEASLRALPSIPEVAAARQALEDELDYVNSKK
mmetsp:Transcript_96007/g.253603  ORF Transcript_96007/g.253603 Transcript_96007/m.253603 type:complete len:881 (+) Transcript_96007:103-2745(+)